jgi:hypothetical protein
MVLPDVLALSAARAASNTEFGSIARNAFRTSSFRGSIEQGASVIFGLEVAVSHRPDGRCRTQLNQQFVSRMDDFFACDARYNCTGSNLRRSLQKITAFHHRRSLSSVGCAWRTKMVGMI